MNENFSPAVSVVIPMYNVEKYLPVCLESLLMQTFTDFELLIVDDCSTDSSCAIAESYLERFNGRLKIISLPENTGSGAVPRNVGLDLSQGKYVYFMDADDFLLDNALETLYEFAETYRTDVVCMEKAFECGAEPVPKDFTNEISLIPPRFLTSDTIFETNDITERIEKFLKLSIGHTPWLKFLRRDLLVDNEIKFPAMRISEDTIWTLKILCSAKNWLRVPNTLYVYRSGENSMMTKKRPPRDELRFWLNPLLIGIDCLDEFMNGFEIFNQADNLRLRVLNFFAKIQLDFMAEAFKSLEPREVYEIFSEDASKIKGDHSALISWLLVTTNLYRNGLIK